MKNSYHKKLKQFHLLWALLVGAVIFLLAIPAFAPGAKQHAKTTVPTSTAVLPAPGAPNPSQARSYPVHSNIIASMFYVGEPGTNDNGFIPNRASTWDEQWEAHYGGVDDPSHRNGWLPRFTPRQNPFYVALPYSDLDDNGQRKASASAVYWTEPQAAGGASWVKDRWVEVCYRQMCAYGQWEDAGPFGEDDMRYVFGRAAPANTEGIKAGIDVSPALNDYLRINGDARVNWRFVDSPAVPAGPWRDIVNR